jgi:hypothetical protein
MIKRIFITLLLILFTSNASQQEVAVTLQLKVKQIMIKQLLILNLQKNMKKKEN